VPVSHWSPPRVSGPRGVPLPILPRRTPTPNGPPPAFRPPNSVARGKVIREAGPVELHEYAGLDATGLRELIRSGAVRPDEVEAVAREALEIADADLNALTGPLFEPALEYEPDGPLAGVPFVITDSGPLALR